MRLEKIKTFNTGAIAIILTLLIVSTAIAIPSPVNAQVTIQGGAPANAPNGAIALPTGKTADYQVAPNAYLSFRPNPVGVNQNILVNIWIDPGPSYARYFPGNKVTITKPDGTQDVVTLNSYPADGTSWFEYTVTQVGIWTFKYDFPGGYFPAGNYTIPPGVNMAGYTESYTKSVYYLPASTPVQNLTVQQDMISSWQATTLPTNQ